MILINFKPQIHILKIETLVILISLIDSFKRKHNEKQSSILFMVIILPITMVHANHILQQMWKY